MCQKKLGFDQFEFVLPRFVACSRFSDNRGRMSASEQKKKNGGGSEASKPHPTRLRFFPRSPSLAFDSRSKRMELATRFVTCLDFAPLFFYLSAVESKPVLIRLHMFRDFKVQNSLRTTINRNSVYLISPECDLLIDLLF